MMWNEKHNCVLKNRKDAIKLLPNVKPRKAKWLLDEIKGHFLGERYQAACQGRAGCAPYSFDGLTITEPEFKSMMVSVYNECGYEIDYITPEGAALLVKMYRAGCFKLKGEPGGTEELERYAASSDKLMKAYSEQAEFATYKQSVGGRWKDSPEEFPENMFTAFRLNDIMWHHGVNGMNVSMEIGGIVVTKSLTKSDSGKSQEFKIVMTWTGSDGSVHEEVLLDSAYMHGNDAGRNWGLPE
jgi:hypothetical protein